MHDNMYRFESQGGHERWLDSNVESSPPIATSVAAQPQCTKQADGRDDGGADGHGGVDRPLRAKLACRSRIGLAARSARTRKNQEHVRSKRQAWVTSKSSRTVSADGRGVLSAYHDVQSWLVGLASASKLALRTQVKNMNKSGASNRHRWLPRAAGAGQ